jgi:hypothetical protein
MEMVSTGPKIGRKEQNHAKTRNLRYTATADDLLNKFHQ